VSDPGDFNDLKLNFMVFVLARKAPQMSDLDNFSVAIQNHDGIFRSEAIRWDHRMGTNDLCEKVARAVGQLLTDEAYERMLAIVEEKP